MKNNFDAALREILKSEGGYVDHPRDPGGCTNKGITLATYRRIKPDATCFSLRNIQDDVVRGIYNLHYWDTVSGDDLPPGIDLVVFDMAVNAGPRRASKLLQKILGVDDDGIIGPVTLKAASEAFGEGPEKLLGNYAEARISFYKKLRHFDTFGKGWLRRVASSSKAAHAIIDNIKPPTPDNGQDTLAELQALVEQFGILVAKMTAERMADV